MSTLTLAVGCHAGKAASKPDAAQVDEAAAVDGPTRLPKGDGSSDPPTAIQPGTLQLTASPDRVCPGQCATLTLSPPPDADRLHTWQPDSLEGPGPQRVCPTGTTRYSVQVAGEAAGVEFGPVAETASTTVWLRDDCDGMPAIDGGADVALDGGLTDADGGHADGGSTGMGDPLAIPPPDPDWGPWAPPACQFLFTSTDTVIPIAVGGGERPIVVGWFRGSLNIGSSVLTSGSQWSNGFIVRYDADCQVMWARSLFGLQYTVASDVLEARDGSVFVTGAMSGLADPGLGALDSGAERDLLLLRLEPETGAPIWQQRFRTTETPGSNQVWWFWGVDTAGRLRLQGSANRNTDLGLGPLAPPAAPGSGESSQVVFLARIAKDGQVFESRLTPAEGMLALANDGSMRAAWHATGPVAFGVRELGDPGEPYQALSRLGPTGAHDWHVVVPEGLPDGRSTGDELAVDGNGTTYWSLASRELQPSRHATRYTVAAIDADGGFLWRSPVTFAFTREVVRSSDITHTLAVDGQGRPWVAGGVDGSLPVAGRTVSVMGRRDIAVLRLGPDGQPDFGALLGSGGDDYPVLLHGLRSGAAVVVHGTDGNTVRLARLVPGNQ